MCDIQLMSKQAKINVKIVRTDKLYIWKKLSKLKKSVFLYFFALMLDNLHLYLGGQVVIVTFLKLLHRIFFTCSCLKINKTSTWIGGRVVIIRNQAGSGSWGSGGHWEPALPEASSENKGFFLKFKTASLPFFYWDSDDGTFCLKVYWGKVVDKQEGSVSQWINNQKEFFQTTERTHE